MTRRISADQLGRLFGRRPFTGCVNFQANEIRQASRRVINV